MSFYASLFGRRTNSLIFLASAATLVLLFYYGEHRSKLYANVSKSKQEIVQPQYEPTLEEKYHKRRKQRKKIIAKSQSEPATSRPPDSIVIGVRKCGTGAFRDFIRLHPLISMKHGEAHYYDKQLDRGLEHYMSMLPNGTKYEVVMEKTPAYFVSQPADLPSIIHQDSPDVKLIVLLCNPVPRAFSDYAMRTRNDAQSAKGLNFKQYMHKYVGEMKNMLQNVSMRDDERTVAKNYKAFEEKKLLSFAVGIYAYFIRRWMHEFPPNQLLILDGEEFINDPGPVMERVQSFLGIPKILLAEDFVRNPKTGMFCVRPWWELSYSFEEELSSAPAWEENLICAGQGKGVTRARTATQTIPPNEAKALEKFFRPYNEILFKIIGEKFTW